jgi:EmrB/QacA subfamily drug resistance transporter
MRFSHVTSNRWAALGVLCLGSIMVMLDSSILNVAIPALAAGLPASLDQVLWVINAYTITWAVLLITSGRLGDRYGQRPIFAFGLVVFVCGSAACGLAQNPAQLIGARSLQGIGGALLSPQCLAILQVLFRGESRASAISLYAGLITLGPVLAQPLGGVLVTFLGWRWVFFVNLPVGIVALVLTFWLVPQVRAGRGKVSMDPIGVALLGAALFGASFGVLEGARYNWGAVAGVISIPVLLAASVCFLALFLVWNARHSSPLVPGALFRDRTYTLMCTLYCAASIGMLALFLPLSIYLQSTLGLTALQAGLSMLPLPATVLVLNAFGANRLAARMGFRWTLVCGLACVGIGTAVVGLSAGTIADWLTLAPGMVILAAGPGLIFAPLTTVAVRGVPPEMAGAASGVLSSSGQLGGVLGSALVGVIFVSTTSGVDALHTALVIPLLVAMFGSVACLLWMEPDTPPVARAFVPRLAAAESSGTNWRQGRAGIASSQALLAGVREDK